MSKLEVKSAIYLQKEYPKLLPRVNVQSQATLTNEMNANSMLKLFLQSKWSQNNNNETIDEQRETITIPKEKRKHNAGIATELFDTQQINENNFSDQSENNSSVEAVMDDMNKQKQKQLVQ